jgi:hypothetical protein
MPPLSVSLVEGAIVLMRYFVACSSSRWQHRKINLPVHGPVTVKKLRSGGRLAQRATRQLWFALPLLKDLCPPSESAVTKELPFCHCSLGLVKGVRLFAEGCQVCQF